MIRAPPAAIVWHALDCLTQKGTKEKASRLQLQNAFCCGSLHLTQPLRAGLKDYKVLKTTQSGYVGYLKDKYTLLPETTERMAATSITASWRWGTSLFGRMASHVGREASLSSLAAAREEDVTAQESSLEM